ncbi:hypothetical protein N864_03650 [Intrasporangium chromatireducens Q5-1]|uniref:Alkylmercury lyase n=1 Tax=Intrasporangium chromatireducens Q5-1 TaxID=584657 RepID=W9GHB4_9MICO|nr:hypothetical protein [Intrasporangium chromatireducens]EWT05611.1 hypothetical protein N864_03650 [Intrasporangium chromatireducens Q5-1]
MNVELLVIPQCPGLDEAARLLRTALNDIGLAQTPFTVEVIDTDERARSRGFAGSPAFVVDGVDLFASAEAAGSMACRVYSTPDGLRNVPAVRDLRQALKEQAAKAAGSDRGHPRSHRPRGV